MTRPLSAADLRQLHRFLDQELQGEALESLRHRLEADGELRRRLQELQALRGGFVAVRAERPLAPAGFAADVLAAVRSHSLEQGWRRDVVDDGELVRLCRRLLLAAVVLFALGLLLRSGLFGFGAPKQIEAGPPTIEREIERLDRLIRAGSAASGETAGPGEQRSK